MATQVQRRRGTSAEYASTGFVGAEGEFTYDKTLKTIRVHDGSTAGGFPLLKKITSMTPATKCKITYNEDGIVTGGGDIEMSDLPSDLMTTFVQANEAITPVPAGYWKCKVRYDAKGLVLEGADLEVSDIPENIPQSKIQNLSTDLAGKMDQISVVVPTNSSGTIQLIDNAVNRVVLTGSATLQSPAVSGEDVNKLHQLVVQLHKPDIAYTVTFADNKYFGSNAAPDISSVGFYNIYYEFDTTQNAWVLGAIRKLTAA